MATLSGSGSTSSSPLLKGISKNNPVLWRKATWVSSSSYMVVSDDIGKLLQLTPVKNATTGESYYPMSTKDLTKFIDLAITNKLPPVASSAVSQLVGRFTYTGKVDVADATNLAVAIDKSMKKYTAHLSPDTNPVNLAYVPKADAFIASNGKSGNKSYFVWTTGTGGLKGNLPNAPDSYTTFSREQAASNYVDSFLQMWPQLNTPKVQQELTNAINRDPNGKAIISALYNVDPKKDPKNPLATTAALFQASYPALIQAQKTGTGIAVQSPAQYDQLVSQYKEVLTNYGLPANSITNEEITNMIMSHVSPTQLGSRAALAYEAANAAPQSVRNALSQQYGVNPGHIALAFLDPKNSYVKIQDDLNTQELYAKGQGVQGFTKDMAAELAAGSKSNVTTAGQYSIGQANAAIETAQRGQGLMTSTPGAAQPTVDTTTLIGSQIAGFGGTGQVAAQQAVQRAAQARTAAFEKGGGFVETAKGITGLGSAKT